MEPPISAHTAKTDIRTFCGKDSLLIRAVGFCAVTPFAARAQSASVPAATPGAIVGENRKSLTFPVASVDRNVAATGACDPFMPQVVREWEPLSGHFLLRSSGAPW